MRYRKFGNPSLFVSGLCLGTMTFGGAEGEMCVAGAECPEAGVILRAPEAYDFMALTLCMGAPRPRS